MSDTMTANEFVESMLAPAEDPSKRKPEATDEKEASTEAPHEADEATTASDAAVTTKSNSDDPEVEDLSNDDNDSEEQEEETEAEEDEGEETDEESDDGEETTSEDDEDPEGTEEEEDSDQEVVYTTKDGDEVTLEELKRGHMRQADYTRKTQEVAEQRQEVEQAREQVTQHNNVLAEHLNIALQVIEPTLAQYSQVNWEQLANDDPYEYAEHQAKFQQAQMRYAQVQQAAKQSLQQEQQRRDATLEATKKDEATKLAMAIPDLADPKKGKDLAHSIKQYGLNKVGLSEQEAANLIDHRLINVLNKARMFDEMTESGLSLSKKKRAKGPKKVVKSGSPMSKGDKQTAARKEAGQRVAKTGSTTDAVEWLLS